MPTNTVEYRCLLISPNDVTAERDALTEQIVMWNAQIGRNLNARIDLVRWESHAVPDMANPAQDTINSQLVDECDLGIALFWSRLGTKTTSHPSGSVEEVYRLLQKKARVMVYFCSRPIPQEALRDDQYPRLKEVRSKFEAEGLLATFSDAADLCSKVQLHLTNVVSAMVANDRHASSVVPASGTATAPTPDVRVVANPGAVVQPGSGRPAVHHLKVTVQNHSPSVVYLQNICLETKDGQKVMALRDFVTEQVQRHQALNPGQSLDFHFDPEDLRSYKDNLVCAVVSDAIGRTYRSDPTHFPGMVEMLLNI